MFLINSKQGQALIKNFDRWTMPVAPHKRKLTEKENDLMYKHFLDHSWSSYVDATGKIVLGNGIDEGGMFYITEEDLKTLS